MENKETFQYTYDAAQRAAVDAIRRKYLPREETPLERLRRLDAIPGKRAAVWGIFPGVVGTLALGTGMSLFMSDFGAALGALSMTAGIAVGLLGLTLVASAYPVYRAVLGKNRRRLAPEILALSQELMQ